MQSMIYKKSIITNLTVDDKDGKRVKGKTYNPSGKEGEGIEIVGDYYALFEKE